MWSSGSNQAVIMWSSGSNQPVPRSRRYQAVRYLGDISAISRVYLEAEDIEQSDRPSDIAAPLRPPCSGGLVHARDKPVEERAYYHSAHYLSLRGGGLVQARDTPVKERA